MKLYFILLGITYTTLCFSQTGAELLLTRNNSIPLLVSETNCEDTETTSKYRDLQIFDGEIYARTRTELFTIDILDLDFMKTGEILIDNSDISLANSFRIIDQSTIAIFDNDLDNVFFANFSGEITRIVSIQENGMENQNFEGIVYNNQLIISSDENQNIISVNLLDYTLREFKDLSSLNLEKIGSIAEHEGTFYCGSENNLIKFTEETNPEIIFDFNGANVTHLIVDNNILYFTVNFEGIIYQYDIIAESFSVFKEDITTARIDDMEILIRTSSINSLHHDIQQLTVFPNPSCSQLLFTDRTFGIDKYEYRIYDTSSRNVLEIDNKATTVDISHLKNGVYFLVSESLYDKTIKTVKFVKDDCE